MTLALLADRVASMMFMLAGAGLLAWGHDGRRARIGWIALITLGLAYGLALNLNPVNFPHSNYIHYYLGAKYPAPYTDTYRLVQAGLGRPQVGIRDLEHPGALVRATEPAQRAYYIDLLRAAHVPFDPLASVDTLSGRARDSGVIEAEAAHILETSLPPQRIAGFREDVRTIASIGQGPQFTLDYGYNGSPFYGLLRQADPTLHLPFGRTASLAGLAWQLLGVALIALLAGAALGLSVNQQLAVAALILVSEEFANFAMPGLVFTELWVPVLVAVWALRRDRPVVAGIAIAVAGLLKLFPFALLAAAVVPFVRSYLSRGAPATGVASLRRRSLLVIASCVITTVALGLIAPASGRNWPDFLHKITTEFQSGINMINSVSASILLVVLGVPAGSILNWMLPPAVLAVLLAMFWARPDAGDDDAPARRSLILVGCLGWFFSIWLHYYVVAPLLMLPWLARRHRVAAGLCAVAMAGSYLLPAFYDPRLMTEPVVHGLKILPYLAVPAVLAAFELRAVRLGTWSRRGGLVLAGLLALVTGVEIWRGATIRRLATAGEAALAADQSSAAVASYDGLVRLAPRDVAAQRRRAIALATAGRLDEALAGFARAVSLAPLDPAAHDDYGRALLMTGRLDAAADEFERARGLEPTDVQVLFQLAHVRSEQGRIADEVALLTRARELAPDEPAIVQALEQAQSR